MWKDKLQEIIQEKKIYGEKINIGATEDEIEIFFKEAKIELNVDLPNDYANILEIVNGLEFNGFILYGIDQNLLSKQPNQSINGLKLNYRTNSSHYHLTVTYDGLAIHLVLFRFEFLKYQFLKILHFLNFQHYSLNLLRMPF